MQTILVYFFFSSFFLQFASLYLRSGFFFVSLIIEILLAFLLGNLIELCRRFCETVPTLKGIDLAELSLLARTTLSVPLFESSSKEKGQHPISSQPQTLLSPIEENDIDEILLAHRLDLGNVDDLTIRLSGELDALEGANVHALIESENAVLGVISMIEDMEGLLGLMSNWLSVQSKELGGLRKHIALIEEKSTRMDVQTQNHYELLQVLNSSLEKLKVSNQVAAKISNVSISTAEGLKDACNAAAVLTNSLKATFPDGMMKMAAVREGMSKIADFSTIFTKNVVEELSLAFSSLETCFPSNIHISIGTSLKDVYSIFRNVHSKIMPFQPLILFLKEFSLASFNTILKLYCGVARRMYSEKLKLMLMDVVDKGMAKTSHECRLLHLNPLTEKNRLKLSHIHSLVQSQSNPDDLRNALSQSSLPVVYPTVLTFFEDSSQCLEVMSEPSLFNFVLHSLTRAVLEEEELLSSVFGLSCSEQSSLPAESSFPDRTTLLSSIFANTTQPLIHCIEKVAKYGQFSLFSLLVIADAYSPSSDQLSFTKSYFLENMLTEIQITIKKLLSKFLDEQVVSIQQCNPQTKRCGILPPIQKLPLFFDHLIVHGVTLRKEIGTLATHKLMLCIFKWLNDFSNTDPKYKDVIRFENFHHLYVQLRQRQVMELNVVLEPYVHQAEEAYHTHLERYVAWIAECQFTKLFAYFKEMASLCDGLPASDIQFQNPFSKSALHTTLKHHTSNMDKQILSMYRRIHKHLNQSQEKMLPVAWNSLQEYILERWSYFSALLTNCYVTEEMTPSSKEMKQFFDDAEMATRFS
eukprot:GCRY01001665.1.p1 GENE.GCRY01001665.1~~GCRY01001665.1.p1  ORF type:complete len:808 (-),score=101.67 GCRY01001665.1:201-2624(-)